MMNALLSTSSLPAAPVTTVVDIAHAMARVRADIDEAAERIGDILALKASCAHEADVIVAEVAFWRDVQDSLVRQLRSLRDAERRERAHSDWYEACEALAN